MQVLEAPVVSERGLDNLEKQISKTRLQLQVLQKVEAFCRRLAAGKISDQNAKKVEAQRFGGVSQPNNRSEFSLIPGGLQNVYQVSDDLAITTDGEPCVWRKNIFGTGWVVIPARHIAAMRLDELNLFMSVKLP